MSCASAAPAGWRLQSLCLTNVAGLTVIATIIGLTQQIEVADKKFWRRIRLGTFLRLRQFDVVAAVWSRSIKLVGAWAIHIVHPGSQQLYVFDR